MTSVLLKTKLHIPVARSRQVSRPQLLKRLDSGLHSKLTLISAPAGFGKTTLVAAWVKARNIPTAWLSLDHEDNDPGRFWAYFIASLQTVSAGAGESLLASLRSASACPTEALLTELVNEIREINTSFLFVLDDFHVIENRQIQAGVWFVIDHLPPVMHLVIATRADPPWPLARLRGQAEITELRMVDLRLTLAESGEFLNSVMDLGLIPEQVLALDKRTEGWITGLQLAGLSMRGREDRSEFIDALTGSQQFILDYLVEEVLDRQPPAIHEFLLQTSILDRLTAQLCDALTDRQDGQSTLAWLEKSNLFLFPLDDERRWYRYHRLFADLLRSSLQQRYPGMVRQLHRKASLWHASVGMISEAMTHAFQSGDVDLVARLIEENTLTIITVHHEHLPALAGWLDALPAELFSSRPWLSVARAWILAYSGELEAAEAVIQNTEQVREQRLPGDGDEIWRREHLTGYLAAIRGYCSFMQGDNAASAKWMEQARLHLPADGVPTSVFCAIVLGAAIGMQGDLAGGMRVLSDAVSGWRGSGNPLLPLMVLSELAGLQILAGMLTQAMSTCEQAVRLANGYARLMGISPPVVSFAYARLCFVLRERNDLLAAIRYGQQAVQNSRDWGQKDCQAMSLTYLALALQAAGRAEEARQMAVKARQVSSEISPSAAAPAAAYQARILAAQGETASLAAWAAQSGIYAHDELVFSRMREYLVYVRFLITQEKYDAGLKFIDRLLPVAVASGTVCYEIELLVLQALTLSMRGNLRQAVETIEQALKLAEPEGYVRVFVDEGQNIKGLLQHAFGRGIAVHYVRMLLAALDDSVRAQGGLVPGSVGAPPPGSDDSLTRREIEILRLLMTPRSIPDIADELSITVNTLRTHLRNIYDKLGVHNRMQAVSAWLESQPKT